MKRRESSEQLKLDKKLIFVVFFSRDLHILIIGLNDILSILRINMRTLIIENFADSPD